MESGTKLASIAVVAFFASFTLAQGNFSHRYSMHAQVVYWSNNSYLIYYIHVYPYIEKNYIEYIEYIYIYIISIISITILFLLL